MKLDRMFRLVSDMLATVDELNAMPEFYSSTHGASAMRKFGAYMADVMPAVQEEVILGLDRMERQVE